MSVLRKKMDEHRTTYDDFLKKSIDKKKTNLLKRQHHNIARSINSFINLSDFDTPEMYHNILNAGLNSQIFPR